MHTVSAIHRIYLRQPVTRWCEHEKQMHCSVTGRNQRSRRFSNGVNCSETTGLSCQNSLHRPHITTYITTAESQQLYISITQSHLHVSSNIIMHLTHYSEMHIMWQTMSWHRWLVTFVNRG